MLSYIIRRLVYMVVLLVMLSVATFIIIQLPPGDYLTTLVANMRRANVVLSEEALAVLTERYGLGRPLHIQYLTWFGQPVEGRHGRVGSSWEAPVTEIVGERLALTVTLSISTLIVTYLIAIPIGIYSATHQYSVADYSFTTLGFIGLATPNFLLALILMFPVLQVLRLERGRTVFAGVPVGAVEPRQGDRPDQALSDSAAGDRHRRRQPA